MRPNDRHRGALLGLAAGDALGTTLEFTGPLNPFTPQVTSIVGGGPFGLPAGGWTDDTSMALCLGQSLVAVGGFDAKDQIDRYVRWWQRGENSVTGSCFDIGNATSAALQRYTRTGDPFAGDPSPSAAGNGSLMRLAPVAMAAASEDEAVAWAGLQSRVTHAAPEAVDACRFYARLIWRALVGADRAALLDPSLADGLDLAPAVDAVAHGSYQRAMPPAIKGTGYVVQAMEAALWAFHQSSSFEAGAILAVNLGQDADTTGAIYGQLAGAHYGEQGIPDTWRDTVLWREQIVALADDLAELGARRAGS
ncbi:ADP-ribosylglycohydrolase family protein [Oscillochloris sp. ZM17-4]|uniref:ADP-ribosylglycohydrolase family protein n=1 Tax=Oscillochloris sp. ZM17-4 TaxID=2866714 RepID=UPI001C733F39|nr:ADP-ribosylglycohydrolase family protein [Oscillochloris sp. ZM17-4]MBX0331399.1 ADP-ribosylglycohydrolase family protein [Oscillochloris sp. ZM17-4]